MEEVVLVAWLSIAELDLRVPLCWTGHVGSIKEGTSLLRLGLRVPKEKRQREMSLGEVEAECPGALGILAGGMKRSVAMEEEDVACTNVPRSNEVCIGLYINSSLEFLGGRKRPPCPFRTARKPCRSRFGFVGPMILVALLGRLVRVFSVLGLNCHHRAANTPHRHEVIKPRQTPHPGRQSRYTTRPLHRYEYHGSAVQQVHAVALQQCRPY